MDASAQTYITAAIVVVGGIVLFVIVNRVMRFVFSLAITAAIVAAAVYFCVKAGYISQETADRINPLNNETVRESVKDAGEWAKKKTRRAVKRAVKDAVVESMEDDAAVD